MLSAAPAAAASGRTTLPRSAVAPARLRTRLCGAVAQPLASGCSRSAPSALDQRQQRRRQQAGPARRSLLRVCAMAGDNGEKTKVRRWCAHEPGKAAGKAGRDDSAGPTCGSRVPFPSHSPLALPRRVRCSSCASATSAAAPLQKRCSRTVRRALLACASRLQVGSEAMHALTQARLCLHLSLAVVEKAGVSGQFEIDSCGTGGGSSNWYLPGGFRFVRTPALGANPVVQQETRRREGACTGAATRSGRCVRACAPPGCIPAAHAPPPLLLRPLPPATTRATLRTAA